MKAQIRPKGRLHVAIRDERGLLKEELTTSNLVVNDGLYHIANQLAGQSEAAMSHMAIGTGTTPPAPSDTALGSELDRNALTSKTQGSGGDANKVTYVADWAAGDGTGAITEAAVFNSSSAGDMLCRATFPVKNKGANDTMTLTWELTIQ
jgi:hypothetical protein